MILLSCPYSYLPRLDLTTGPHMQNEKRLRLATLLINQYSLAQLALAFEWVGPYKSFFTENVFRESLLVEKTN